MVDKKIKEEELIKQGWKFVNYFGFTSKIFKKNNGRILWDSKKEKITHHYKFKE